jgi:hypothetical protein
MRSFADHLPLIFRRSSLLCLAIHFAGFINFAHDPLRPLHRRRDHRFRSRARTIVKQVFCCLQMPRHENRCHDSDDSFATLIHDEAWYTFRLVFATQLCHACSRASSRRSRVNTLA